MRSSNADILWIAGDEVSSHPGGPSHLSVFDFLAEESGLKPKPFVAALMILNVELESEEERVIDHIVGYNLPSGFYLVKWQDSPCQDATWEHEVEGEHAIEAFRRRKQYQPRV
jgi:hypothetical protein